MYVQQTHFSNETDNETELGFGTLIFERYIFLLVTATRVLLYRVASALLVAHT